MNHNDKIYSVAERNQKTGKLQEFASMLTRSEAERMANHQNNQNDDSTNSPFSVLLTKDLI